MDKLKELKLQYDDVAHLINLANNALGKILVDIITKIKEIEHGTVEVRHQPAGVPEQQVPGPQRPEVPTDER